MESNLTCKIKGDTRECLAIITNDLIQTETALSRDQLMIIMNEWTL